MVMHAPDLIQMFNYTFSAPECSEEELIEKYLGLKTVPKGYQRPAEHEEDLSWEGFSHVRPVNWEDYWFDCYYHTPPTETRAGFKLSDYKHRYGGVYLPDSKNQNELDCLSENWKLEESESQSMSPERPSRNRHRSSPQGNTSPSAQFQSPPRGASGGRSPSPQRQTQRGTDGLMTPADFYVATQDSASVTAQSQREGSPPRGAQERATERLMSPADFYIEKKE